MNLNNQKVKRKVGALDGKIWTADDCWEAENEIINSKGNIKGNIVQTIECL